MVIIWKKLLMQDWSHKNNKVVTPLPTFFLYTWLNSILAWGGTLSLVSARVFKEYFPLIGKKYYFQDPKQKSSFWLIFNSILFNLFFPSFLNIIHIHTFVEIHEMYQGIMVLRLGVFSLKPLRLFTKFVMMALFLNLHKVVLLNN